MRVVAKTEDRYLISVNDDLAAVMQDVHAQARVLRTREGTLSNPTNIHKFIGLPGWDGHLMTREETDALLAQFGVTSPTG